MVAKKNTYKEGRSCQGKETEDQGQVLAKSSKMVGYSGPSAGKPSGGAEMQKLNSSTINGIPIDQMPNSGEKPYNPLDFIGVTVPINKGKPKIVLPAPPSVLGSDYPFRRGKRAPIAHVPG